MSTWLTGASRVCVCVQMANRYKSERTWFRGHEAKWNQVLSTVNFRFITILVATLAMLLLVVMMVVMSHIILTVDVSLACPAQVSAAPLHDHELRHRAVVGGGGNTTAERYSPLFAATPLANPPANPWPILPATPWSIHRPSTHWEALIKSTNYQVWACATWTSRHGHVMSTLTRTQWNLSRARTVLQLDLHAYITHTYTHTHIHTYIHTYIHTCLSID